MLVFVIERLRERTK